MDCKLTQICPVGLFKCDQRYAQCFCGDALTDIDTEHCGKDFEQNADKVCIVNGDDDVTYKLVINYCSDTQLRSGCMECDHSKCLYCAASTGVLVNDESFCAV